MTTPAPPITAVVFRRGRRRVRVRRAAATAAWAVAFLVAADVALNVAFHRPASPRTDPTGLRGYLEYGRSTEGRLAYLVGPTDAASGKMVPVGWVDAVARSPEVLGPTAGGPPRLRASVFGMSFSNQIGRAMAAADPAVQVRLYGGPAAPPNHTFALYQAVRRLGPPAPAADVVVWGILADSVKDMTTMTGLTWTFASPAPFCYPRYTLDTRGRLLERWPSVRTEADLRAAVADPARMAAFRDSLAAGDRFYDPVTFRRSPLDRSALARMAHRAYADHHAAVVGAKIDRKDGFAEDDPDVGPVLRAMCRQFAAAVRADGRRPVVVLIQDQSSPDHLARLLAPSLAADGIPYLDTHAIVSATDRSHFVTDGHFTPANTAVLARALLRMIDAERAR